MSVVICGDEFDLDIDYKHRVVTIQAVVEFNERDECGVFIATPSTNLDVENSSASVRFEALPSLIRQLQGLVDADRGPREKQAA